MNKDMPSSDQAFDAAVRWIGPVETSGVAIKFSILEEDKLIAEVHFPHHVRGLRLDEILPRPAGDLHDVTLHRMGDSARRFYTPGADVRWNRKKRLEGQDM